ncbi:MAG: sulfatase-like hydrolase/transferase [Gemmatimonadota bacterium]|nr:sulfatase-like hydrolase/transferase [Gemmatimonadota bacterium]
MTCKFRNLILLPVLAALLGCSSGGPKLKGPLPNILLIVMDAARADHFSCHGYGRPTTPNADRLAARGLKFTQAVASSSWTLPSHASLFTGLLPNENGTHTQHGWLIDRIPTLAELLKSRGYRTAAFSNNPFVDRAQNLHRGFGVFEAVWSDTAAVTRAKPYNTERTNELVRAYLAGASGKAPFFIFINYMDPHQPYDPPEPYKSMFLAPGRRISARTEAACSQAGKLNSGELVLEAKEIEDLVAVYDGAICYLDARIGDLLEFMQERGLLENTLVVVTSDHGEMFGEHGHFTHGTLLYRPLIQIPLIMAHPALIPEPGVIEEPVAIADIFHTIIGLLEIDGAAPTGAPVRNLLESRIDKQPSYSLLKIGRNLESHVVHKHDIRSLWTPDQRHLLVCDDESYELYDLAADPGEANNLCLDASGADRLVSEVTAFEKRLVVFEELPGDLRLASRHRIDPAQVRAMRALGYVGGTEMDEVFRVMEEDEHPHVMEHLRTGIAFFRTDSLAAAEKEIRTVLKMSPHNTTARKYLGGILYDLGEYEEALRILRSILGKTKVEANVRTLIGSCLAHLNRLEEALEIFRRISDEDPSDANSAFSAAGILIGRKDFTGAEVYIGRMLGQNPVNITMLRRLIGLYLDSGNFARARQLLLKELEEEPNFTAHLLISEICDKLGQREEMKAHLEAALEMELPPEVRTRVEDKLDKL